MTNIKYPFGEMEKIVLDGGSALPETTIEKDTIIDIVEDGLSAARTLNLKLGDNVVPGTLLYLKAKADGGERVLTIGTKITDQNWTIASGKTEVCLFIFDADADEFLPTGGKRQID